MVALRSRTIGSGVPAGATLKAFPIVLESDGEMKLVVVRGDHRVNEIKLQNTLGQPFRPASAREIENLALTFPRAAETAVIGLPDALTGERVCAVIVPADPADPPTLDELVAHLRAEGLNPRKLPVQLEYVSELPRNAMNKVVKKTLKDQFAR